jgi:hypothetical protein
VARLAQVPQRRRGPSHVPCRDGQGTQHARVVQRRYSRQDLRDAVRTRFEEIEGAVTDAGVLGSHGGRVADVGLTHLEEDAAAWQQPQRRIDEVTRQRVEDHVDPVPTGGGQELLLELQGA